jgi:hypothetical protein
MALTFFGDGDVIMSAAFSSAMTPSVITALAVRSRTGKRLAGNGWATNSLS